MRALLVAGFAQSLQRRLHLMAALFALLSCVLGNPAVATANSSSKNAVLGPAQLGVIINLDDPQSVAVGEYYQLKRHIPASNIVRVRMHADAATLSAKEFLQVFAEVKRKTPAPVQAYALTWLKPYRVECMSITSAFAVGFDPAFCSEGCKTTRPNPYFDSQSHQPMADSGWRPAMSIAATSVEEARKLIDRGVASDGTAPKGTAYLVTTKDTARNVRTPRYALAQALLDKEFQIKRVDAEALTGAPDVMFYFIGALRVPQLTTNRFLPGAIADHLTSTGGALVDTSQMSSLRWLEAGATGSYGSVVEPCNFTAKFPDPSIVMNRYIAGDTLIEAYWKSVLMPGQGLFIGEPLARPFSTVTSGTPAASRLE